MVYCEILIHTTVGVMAPFNPCKYYTTTCQGYAPLHIGGGQNVYEAEQDDISVLDKTWWWLVLRSGQVECRSLVQL